MNGEGILTRHALRRSEARGTGGDPPPHLHEDEYTSIHPRSKLKIRTLHSLATKKAHERTMAAHGLWTLRVSGLRNMVRRT